MSWLDNLVNQHRELESPLAFWKWSALAAISAVVKDNVWIDRQVYKLYPNVYVMLHADSGLKKGPPVSMAKNLVKAVGNTKIISGRSSIQGILKELGTNKTAPGGKVQLGSTAFICSSELSSSLVDDKAAVNILTDLYDRQYNTGNWESLLKSESFNLKSPTVTMLTATNEAMSGEFFTKTAIQGGFLARTFIIHESKRNRANALLVPLETSVNYLESAVYLKELAKLTGSFQHFGSRTESDIHNVTYADRVTGEIYYYSKVGLIYQEWYDELLKQIDDQDVKDPTGTLNRFGDSVLKVAMLYSLAEAPNLIISEKAMYDAISSCEKLIGSVRKTTFGKHGISDSSELKSMIIMEILTRENHRVSRTVLLKRYWMNYTNASEMDDLMLGLDQSGIIKTSNIGNQIIYEMGPEQVKEYKKLMSGKAN